MLSRVFHYTAFFTALYIFIYNPIFQITGFGLTKLLLLISIIFIIKKGLQNKFFQLFKIEITLVFIIILYIITKSVMGNEFGLITAYIHLIWFLESFLIPVFLVLYFKEIHSKYAWESVVVIVGFIASLITLFLILNPETNLYVRQNLIIDTLDSISASFFTFRGFTIAEGSSFSYGIIQGLMIVFCLASIKKNIAFIIPVLFLFISILFNARIGVSVVFVGIALLILQNGIKPSFIFIFGILIILGYQLIIYLTNSFELGESLAWGFGFIDEINSLTRGEGGGANITILINEMLFFPQNLVGLIFGEGKDVFHDNSQNSDIGYIIQIFAGGILYLLLILVLLFVITLKSYLNAENKIIPILFLISILIVNFKGNAFLISMGFNRLMIYYYIFSVFKNIGYLNHNVTIVNE